MIVVEGLSVGYGGRPVVRDVSFRVAPGTFFGLVGESGSGKSTVLRAIAGLHAEWRGRIAIGGVPVGVRRGRAARRRVQMVFQDPYGSLHPRQTVDRILTEPIEVNGMDGADGRVRRALDEVALPPSVRYRYAHQLSGGQRQRVAIARALVAEPEVLLLDEPTSALDVSVQAEILNLLSGLRSSRGLTGVLVSHNLAVVAHLCPALAVMDGGRVVENLETEALLAGLINTPFTQRLRQASLNSL